MAIVFGGFVVLVTVVCGLLAVLLYKFIRPFYSIKVTKLMGPQAFPILGNALEFRGNINFLDKLMEIFDSYPSPLRLWAGNILVCLVYEADHIQTVLASSKTINKADFYKFAGTWLGDGLLTAPEKRWRVHRKLILPTFNMKILESYVEIFAKQAEVMTTLMRKELHGDEFNISRYVSLATVDILCETMMGIKLNVQTDENNRFVHCTTRITDILCQRVFKIWLYPDIIFNNTKLGKELDECLAYVHSTTHSIIRRKKNEYNNSNKASNDDSEIISLGSLKNIFIRISTVFVTFLSNIFGLLFFLLVHPTSILHTELHTETPGIKYTSKCLLITFNNTNNFTVDRPLKRKTFMDLLMELSNEGAKLTEEEIREEVTTMMVVGYDSSATVKAFVLTILAIRSDVQEKVYQELCDIYGDEVNSDTSVKHEDLNRMEYLDRVIKETLRIFPLAPIIARNVNEDLQIGEYTLPKGCTVVTAIYKMHRSEKYWREPLKFDPDRFLPENVAKQYPHCYMPFSSGPRNCLGIKYAYMSMKTTIATVLRRYILSKQDKSIEVKDIKVKVGPLLRPVDELKIKITQRKVVNK